MVTIDEMVVKFTATGEPQVKGAFNSYEQSLNKATQTTQTFSKSGNQATLAMTDFSRVMQDAPYGIRGVANNLNPMWESFQRLTVSAGGFKGAFKAMLSTLSSPAGIGIAIAALSTLAVVFAGNGAKAKEAAGAIKEFSENLDAAEKNVREMNRAQQVTAFWNNEQEIFRLKERYRELSAETQRLAMSRSLLALLFVGGKDEQKKAIEEQVKAFEDYNKKIEEIIIGGDKKDAKSGATERRKKEIENYRQWLETNFPVDAENNVMFAGFTEKAFQSTSNMAKKFREEDAKDEFKKNEEKNKAAIAFNKADVENRAKGYKDFIDEQEKIDKEHAKKLKELNKKIYEDNKVLIETLDSGFMGLASGLEQGLTKAFQRSFGEANSLLEQFALAAGQQLLFELAGMAVGGVGVGGLIGLLFHGGGVIEKAHSGRASLGNNEVPIIAQRGEMVLTKQQQSNLFQMANQGGGGGRPININLQIGRKQLRAEINAAISENVRLRLN